MAASLNINTPSPSKKILIAVLNWGLGHATRCMPIIAYLVQNQHEVILASDGRALFLLQNEFPELQTIELPAYDIQYNSEKGNFNWTMAKQIPKVLKQIKNERKQIRQIVKELQIDLVISDNRFGAAPPKNLCSSVFISHQIFIQLPPSLKLLYNTLNKWNANFIYKYNACWIPDFEDPNNNLSGKLAHLENGERLEKSFYKYIGSLSRFSANLSDKTSAYKYQLIVVLSGPEPQRSLFETELLKQINEIDFAKPVVVVRGLSERSERKKNKNVEIIDHLKAEELEEYLKQSELVLARAGYSTIMDLSRLQKKAILIPTPYQTEQEYLAEILADKNQCVTKTQQKFSLKEALKQSKYIDPISNKNASAENQFQAVLQEQLDKL